MSIPAGLITRLIDGFADVEKDRFRVESVSVTYEVAKDLVGGSRAERLYAASPGTTSQWLGFIWGADLVVDPNIDGSRARTIRIVTEPHPVSGEIKTVWI